jgi:hypothetical protein
VKYISENNIICEKVFQFCKCYTCAVPNSANPQYTASHWNTTNAVKTSEGCQYFVKLNNTVYHKSKNVSVAPSLLPQTNATNITGLKIIWFHGLVIGPSDQMKYTDRLGRCSKTLCFG